MDSTGQSVDVRDSAVPRQPISGRTLGGSGFAFGFWAIGSPNYTDATASVNDVLHLTGGLLIAGSFARCRRV